MKKKAEQDEPKNKLDELVVKKSNDFIVGKYKSSLLEQKLVAIAITRLQMNKNSSITATIFPGELKQMLGKEKDQTHVYRDLKKVSKEMTGHVIELEDGVGEFHIFSLITNADYKDGRFTITFNSMMSDHIFNLKSHFTSYSLANTLQLKSSYSFRLYELIKKDAFKVTDDCPYVMVQYGVSELKFMIGVLDINDKKAREVQDAGGTWDEMAEVCKEKRVTEWSNFKNRILDKAKAELDEVADYTFDYNLIKSGRGGKVVAIEFIIHKNYNRNKNAEQDALRKKNIVEKKNEEYRQLDFDDIIPLPKVLFSYVGHNKLTKQNMIDIYHAAGDDMSLVVKAIELADKASEKNVIENYPGWIISCVKKGGYEEPQSVSNGSAVRGDMIKEAREDLESTTPSDGNDMLTSYWERSKKSNSEKFQEFVEFLQKNGLDKDMLEGMYTKAECGDLYIRFVRKEPIKLF